MTTQNPALSAPLSARALPALLADSALLLLLAVEGALVLGAAVSLGYLRGQHPEEFFAATALAESGWPLLSTAAILVAALACALAYRAVVCAENTKALLLLAVALMAGADFTAVRVIEGVRLMREHAHLVALAEIAREPEPSALEVASLPADPERGRELFAASCSACHGPQGEGKARLGASLVGSPFVQRLDDDGLVEFLKKGRQPKDPDSVMRMVMPPKGGNPALTDRDLRNLAAYSHELAVRAPAPSTASPVIVEPAFEFHHAIAPSSASGPSGLSAAYLEGRIDPARDPLSVRILTAPNRFPSLFLIVGAAHGLLLLAGLLLLSGLASRILNGTLGGMLRTVFYLACVHVQMMAVGWLLLVLFLYGPA